MSVILYIAVQFVSTYVLSLLINPVYTLFNGHISIGIIEMIVNIIVFIVSLLAPALFINSYCDYDLDKNKLNLKTASKCIFIALPLVFIIQIVLGYLFEKFGLNYDIVDKIDIYKDKSIISSILFFIYIAVLPAIFEEFYIRGTVVKYSKKYGNGFAIIVSAILFAALHMNISQALFAFLMGVIFAIIAIKTRKYNT